MSEGEEEELTTKLQETKLVKQIDEKPIFMKLSQTGLITITNENEFDIRIYFTDDVGKPQSLLCNAKTIRNFKTNFKFIYLDDDFKLNRTETVEVKNYKIWSKDEDDRRKEQKKEVVKFESRKDDFPELSTKDNTKEVTKESTQKKSWFEMTEEDDDMNFKREMCYQIMCFETLCTRNGYKFNYQISKNAEIVFTNVFSKPQS